MFEEPIFSLRLKPGGRKERSRQTALFFLSFQHSDQGINMEFQAMHGWKGLQMSPILTPNLMLISSPSSPTSSHIACVEYLW